MNKKIFGIILTFLLLFIPQTAFADFSACALITNDDAIYIDITEQNTLEVRIYEGADEREYIFDITDEEKSNIIEYLESYIKEEEITTDEGIINEFFYEVYDIGYLYGGYANNESKLAYSYDRMLLTKDELDNGYLTLLIEKKLAKENGTTIDTPEEIVTGYPPVEENIKIHGNLTLGNDELTSEEDGMETFQEALKVILPEAAGMLITMLFTSCLVPLIFIIVFIKILKAAAKASNNNQNKRRYQNEDDFFNQAVKEFEEENRRDEPIRYKPKKNRRQPWSNDNDDDPFSVK